ncbi:hypothetical protein JCM9492_00820 [Aquifex pyrophilus]
MKKGLLLAGAVFSLGVLAQSANAVTIKIDENQTLKFGARGIIDATLRGERDYYKDIDTLKNDKSDLQFSHRNARIYFKYKFNKILSAGFQTEFIGVNKLLDVNGDGNSDSDIEILDSYINLAFAPEFNIIAGSYKVPFERHSGLQSGWSVLFPTGPTYGKVKILDTVENQVYTAKHVFTNPLAHKPFRSGSRSAGVTFWGNIAGGMFKYYAGIFDTDDETNAAGEPKTGFAIRVQFTPTMLGYKPEKGYVLKNTYVGKKDVLTVGLSYAHQGYRSGGDPDIDDQTSWGVDVMWEQKFETIVPNLQIGYVKHNNYEGWKDDDRFGWLVQGQLLYDQKIFLGKPALVVKYVRSECDGKGCEVTDFSGKDVKPKLTTWGIGVNYYIKGYANRIALAVDNVKLDDVNVGQGADDSYTDVTLSIFYNF